MPSATAAGILWAITALFAAAFLVQVRRRFRLLVSAPNTISFQSPRQRIVRFLVDVVGQRRTIVERPLVGVAHALVFWGFIAFAGYTLVEFMHGLGIADLTHSRWFLGYRIVLTPFAVAVLVGILG